jgi:hypothetical protein
MGLEEKEADLILAVQAIKRDPNLSIRAVAKVYSMSRDTLAARMKGR